MDHGPDLLQNLLQQRPKGTGVTYATMPEGQGITYALAPKHGRSTFTPPGRRPMQLRSLGKPVYGVGAWASDLINPKVSFVEDVPFSHVCLSSLQSLRGFRRKGLLQRLTYLAEYNAFLIVRTEADPPLRVEATEISIC